MSEGLRIKTNIPAIFANRILSETNARLNKSIERLSSGLRINRAADDAAGFAISERMRTQVNGLARAQLNAQDGVSMIQVAEGGLAQISTILQRLRVLAVQAANDSNTTADRRVIQVEVNQLLQEIDRQASATSFNGRVLLTGNHAKNVPGGTLFFQVGADKGQKIAANIESISTVGLGLTTGRTSGRLFVDDPQNATSGGVLTQKSAESAIALIQSAIDKVSQQRGDLGALQNRLENVITFIGISKENITAAESRVRDTDFAEEIVNFTQQQILQQTGISALSQANISPQIVLALLR